MVLLCRFDAQAGDHKPQTTKPYISVIYRL
jgi:hypothetical protein